MKIWIQRRDGQLARYEKKRRRIQAIGTVMAFALVFLLAFQAITALVRRDQTMGENYLGQPVGPGLQLAVCVVALAVGVILAWRHFHPKPPSEKREKIRSKPFLFRWPHDNIP